MTTKGAKAGEGNPGGLREKIAAARAYFEESRAEMKKVTWPTRAEVRVTTLAVLILVVVMSLFLGVIDFGLVKAVQAITALGI
jgi:preprotein translocase subunit SecE